MRSAYQTREIWCQRDGTKLYGVAYVPDGTGPFPTVIVSHGFAGTYRDNENYAHQFAEAGIASYLFDFRGGSYETKSGGDTREMSVLTQLDDLNLVLEQCGGWAFADPERLFLLGESQGGFVSALAAARRPDLKGLILLYPAFTIAGLGKKTYQTIDAIPEAPTLWGVRLGPRYFSDVWEMDVYGEIAKYQGRVLIFHGTHDDVVPMSSSQQAVEAYQDAALVVVGGAGHGFYSRTAQEPGERMIEFISGKAH